MLLLKNIISILFVYDFLNLSEFVLLFRSDLLAFSLADSRALFPSSTPGSSEPLEPKYLSNFSLNCKDFS